MPRRAGGNAFGIDPFTVTRWLVAASFWTAAFQLDSDATRKTHASSVTADVMSSESESAHQDSSA